MLCLEAVRGGIDFRERRTGLLLISFLFSVLVVYKRQTPLFLFVIL
jgi:hypothetical protein